MANLNINFIRGAMNRANLRKMQQTTIADTTLVYTTNDPAITPDGSVTIADGSAPTAAEYLEFLEELQARIEAITDALEEAGIFVA